MIDAGKLLEKNYIKNSKKRLFQVDGKNDEYFLNFTYKYIGAKEVKEIASDLQVLYR